MFDLFTGIFEGFIGGGLEGLLGQPNTWLFFVLFFLFIIIAYRVVKMLIRAAMIAVLGGLFPIFANMFLGASIPITISSILFFAMTAVEIYFVYSIIVSIGKIAELLTKPFRRGKTKKVEKVIIVEKGKDKHEKEKG